MHCLWGNVGLKDSQLLAGAPEEREAASHVQAWKKEAPPADGCPATRLRTKDGRHSGGDTQTACCPWQSNSEPGTSVLEQKRDSTEQKGRSDE